MGTGERAVNSLASRDDVSNILLLGPTFDAAQADFCSSLIQQAPPEELAMVTVSFSQTPEQQVEEYHDLLGTLPACIRLVCVGEQARLTDPQEFDAGDLPGPLADNGGGVKTVANHADLTDLGIRISESLEAIAEWNGVTARSLCFRSLTPLLVHADDSTVLKFLQALRGKLALHDVAGHFHLDPAAHGEQSIGLLKTAFDGIVELTGDEVTVTTR